MQIVKKDKRVFPWYGVDKKESHCYSFHYVMFLKWLFKYLEKILC
jgi:hypothetical protein